MRQWLYATPVLLTLIWLAFYLPWLDGRHVIPWDAMDEFYPTVFFNAQSLRHGIAPWWNPYIYSGYPQICDPQGMMFSPLIMLWMMLRNQPGAAWFSIGILLHVWMGGLAMAAFMRQQGASRFSALLTASVCMAGGVAASRLEHVPMVLAFAYAATVLLCLGYFLRQPRIGRALLLGLAAGVMCVQLTQLTLLLAMFLGLYGAYLTRRAWTGYSADARRRCVTGLLAAVVLASLLALPQLLFSLAFVHLSNRVSLPLAASAPASLRPDAFLTLLSPNALHALRGHYLGSVDRTGAFLYIGAVPLILIAARLKHLWMSPWRGKALLLLASIAVSTVYVLGVHTAVYPWAFHHLPVIRLFRRPSDAAFILDMALAILAGAAADTLSIEPSTIRRWGLFILAASIPLLILGSVQMGTPTRAWHWETLIPALVAGIAILCIGLRRSSPGRIAVPLCLMLVLTADFITFNLNGALNRERNPWSHFSGAGTAASALETLSHGKKGKLPWRIETGHVPPIWNNGPAIAQLASTQGYNPLRYALYQQIYGARAYSRLPRPRTPWNQDPDSALTDLLGVRYAVLTTADAHSHAALWRHYRHVDTRQRLGIYRNAHVYPRVLTPTHAQVAAGSTIPPAAFNETDFRHTVWLTPRTPRSSMLAHIDARRCTGHVRAVAKHDRPSRLVFQTSATSSGWLVLDDLDFPGWQATLDGRSIPIQRANLMFRAVCLPAGTHRLVFRFSPAEMIRDVLL